MISFIVPAYNEETLIGRTLESLNRAAAEIGEPYEIVVANDASTDRTAEIAESHGARVVSVNRRQIAATRNEGARESIGDQLIFVDADTVVSAEVVRAAIDAMNKGAAGGGSAVSFDGQLPRYAELAFPVMVRVFRATGLACGCFIFSTRVAFDAAGGFDEKLFASEEIAMSLQSTAHRFVDLCNDLKNFDVMRTMYAADIVSVEGDGSETKGQQPVIKKSEDWVSDKTFNGETVAGPFFNGANPDQFTVYFTLDVTPKATGKRITLEEVAIYTVNKADKITRGTLPRNRTSRIASYIARYGDGDDRCAGCGK